MKTQTALQTRALQIQIPWPEITSDKRKINRVAIDNPPGRACTPEKKPAKKPAKRSETGPETRPEKKSREAPRGTAGANKAETSEAEEKDWSEEPPAGEISCLAHKAPRPGLRLCPGSLPSSLHKRLQNSLQSGRDLLRRPSHNHPQSPLVTTVPAVDSLLSGGLARGRLVELVGRRSSGRFSTALATLAAATSTGEAAALIDLGDSLHPRLAMGVGIDMERLLWLRPVRIQHALRGAEMLLASGFPLVVMELGNPPLRGGRGGEAAWLRLARAARAQGAVLLVSSPYRVSGTAAAVVLQAQRGRATWQGAGSAPRLLSGLRSQLSIEKHRGHRPGQRHGIDLITPEMAALGVLPRNSSPLAPRLPSTSDLPAAVARIGKEPPETRGTRETRETPVTGSAISIAGPVISVAGPVISVAG